MERVRGKRKRELVTLDRVLEGMRYAGYHRVATSSIGTQGGVADVHNLVTLSRYGEEFLALVAKTPIRIHVVPFPLTAANEALKQRRSGQLTAAVLIPDAPC
jgi:D-arabinose 1-dehydrogenase-like Zn-dependent alcohol dehydrogenase